MRDPYVVLGVQKGASAAEVKKAFRRAAKQHHPDQNQKDPKAAGRFAEINSAYEILGDSSKRAQFDRGEIDGEGKPKSSGFGSGGFGSGGFNAGGASAEDLFRQFRNMGGGRAGASPQGAPDASDIFGRMFGDTAQRARGEPQRPKPQPGADATVTMTLTLEEIAAGEPKRIRLPMGRDIEVAIPHNLRDGQTVRLRGQGYSSPTGGETGDTMLTMRIAPHDLFAVDGADLRTRVAVSLADAVLGGPVIVPTLGGGVEMAIPAMTSSGRTFRLRGKGLPQKAGTGDLYAVIDITLPESDPELTALMRHRKD